MASLQSNCTFSFKHHLTIADLALLASLGSLHIVWTRGYRMTWHMANPALAMRPAPLNRLYTSHGMEWNGDR